MLKGVNHQSSTQRCSDEIGIGVEVRRRASDGALERQLSHNPRCHIHRRELLKQQLTRIRYLDQRKVCAIVARLTEVNTSFIIILLISFRGNDCQEHD